MRALVVGFTLLTVGVKKGGGGGGGGGTEVVGEGAGIGAGVYCRTYLSAVG